jgi:hypothetical protein
MLPRLFIGLGWFLAGCGSGERSAVSTAADGGDCFTDPFGASPPGTCTHDLPRSDDCASAVPRYDVDVAPILANRCTLCHADRKVAGRVLFDTYPEAYSWYKLMYTQVYSCQMPPSCAGLFPDDERTTLLKWFVCKAPPGPSALHDAGTGSGSDP